jgi:hypothetical protein
MMKSLLRSADRDRDRCREKVHDYASTVTIESTSVPGVRFAVNRISFGRRMELCRRIREIGQKLEFLNAGDNDAGDNFREKVEANLLSHEIDQIYLEWGLVGIESLMIDGEAATVELVIAKGPEALTKEIVEAVKAQCGLTGEQRKN